MQSIAAKLNESLGRMPGRISMFYQPLDGEAALYNADEPLIAASVIKIPIMVEAFRRMRAGTLNPDEKVVLRAEDKMPSCGALTYMHDGLQVTVMDLVVLMIILSDNTATNLLIDRFGPENVNETMRELGIPGITLRRRLFEPELSRRGIQNTITARGVGTLLLKMARGELLGAQDDERMLSILCDQRLNSKLPFFLDGVRIAHKTGEDDGITHDAGVIYAKRQFVLVMLSNETDVPQFERLMQDAALALYRENEE